MNAFYFILSKLGIKDHHRFRLFLRGIALVVGLISAFFVSVLMENQNFHTAFYVFSIVLFSAIIEFVFADVFANRSFPFDTERKLALMEKQLGTDAIITISKRLTEEIERFKACDTSRVSATVHVLVGLNTNSNQQAQKGLLQLTDYVGPEGGKKGRITLINQGVIGRCARTGQKESVDFASAEEYHDLMVREFGFTKSEADRHTKTGRSYLAYPLTNENTFVGVLYFFTTEPQVFPLAADDNHLEAFSREIINYLKIIQLV